METPLPFDRWTEHIVGAQDEASRRTLLAEIGRWRAGHLTDIPALREAAFAMSRLYALLGDSDAAQREAQALVSLCQTPPIATAEELQATRTYLSSLGAKALILGAAARKTERTAPRREASPRKERPRGPEPRPRSPEIDAAALALDGRYDQALRALQGGRGPRAGLLRVWIRLNQALGLDADARDEALRALEQDLRARFAPRPTEAPLPSERPAVDGDDPLSKLLGAPVPRKWKARLSALEEWLDAHPEQVDALAEAALTHHVEKIGLKEPAPWLIRFVAQAYADPKAALARATVARLAKEGAYAVTAYEEAPFEWLVEVLREGAGRGWNEVGVRRGVSARGEPRGRRIWTLRFTEGGVSYQVAAVADSPVAYEPEIAEALAERLRALCPRTVLLAPGAGSAGLRAAVVARGLPATEDADPAALLAAVRAVAPSDVSTPAPAPAPPSRRSDPDALERVRALLTADAAPTEAALVEALSALPRLHPTFRVAVDALEGLPLDARVERTIAFLRAAHEAAPAHARLPEGITIATRLHAAGADEARALVSDATTASRFGGPGIEVVFSLARAFAADGWVVDRVLRGPTARERRGNEVLEALDDGGDGIWRLTLRAGESRAEVWFLDGLSPEGRAAVPVLLDDAPRVIVLGDDDDLVGWFALLGRDALRWHGSAEAARAAVGAPLVAPPAPTE